MNISKLNPIGYEAKTEKGNTYKAKNTWATALTAGTVVMEASPYIFKNSLWAKSIALGKSLSGYLSKVPAKFKLPAELLLSTAMVVMNGYFGHGIDKLKNQKLAAKADEAAQTVDNK